MREIIRIGKAEHRGEETFLNLLCHDNGTVTFQFTHDKYPSVEFHFPDSVVSSRLQLALAWASADYGFVQHNNGS